MAKINTKTGFNAHTVAISAFFVIGQFIITLPFIDSFNSIIGYLVSALFGVLLCLLSPMLFSIKNKVLNNAVMVSVAVFALFVLSETFKTFCWFARDVLIRDSSPFFVILLFGGVCLYFGFRSKTEILKFSLLSFIYSAAALLVVIILLLPNFKLQNIEMQGFDFKEILDSSKTEFLSIFLPVILLGFMGKEKKGALAGGVIIGTVILLIVAVSPILLFGNGFAKALEFPFFEAVSTVSVGKLFSRIDAVIYFVYFFCCLLRIEVGVLAVRFCRKNIK